MVEYKFLPRDGSVIDELLKFKIENVLAIDTETTGLDPISDKLRLIQLAVFGKPVLVIDYLLCGEKEKDALRTLFSLPSVKVFQNAKFDINFLRSAGFPIEGPVFDTMIAANLLRTPAGPVKFGLGSLYEFFTGQTMDKEEQTSDFSGELRKEQIEYAARDAFVLLELRSVMVPALKANNLVDIASIEFECTKAVADMEFSGIYINLDKWSALTEKTREEMQKAEKELLSYTKNTMIQPDFFGTTTSVGINLNSNNQIITLLKDNGIEIDDTSKYSLSSYKDLPIVKSLHEYRKATKLLGGFLEPMPSFINLKSNRIHAHYSQIGAYSGRMSCYSPNMQQIPRDENIRSCFIPFPGNSYIIADYSQIELRVAAQIAQDERMIEAYRSGGDLHRLTASLITGTPEDKITKAQRQAAKAVNFGLIFAMGARGLMAYSQDVYDVEMSLEEAEAFRERYFAAYRGISRWQDSIKKNPPTVSRSLTGRRFYHKEDAGIAGLFNTPVQGSAADIIKNALGSLVKSLNGTGAMIAAVVHDEILLETPEKNAEAVCSILKETMENAGGKYMPDVPLVAEAHITSSWAEK